MPSAGEICSRPEVAQTEKPEAMGPAVRRDDAGGASAASHPLPVIPGRVEREPGIPNHERGLWIPGPRQGARPGMTGEFWARFNPPSTSKSDRTPGQDQFSAGEGEGVRAYRQLWCASNSSYKPLAITRGRGSAY